MIDASLARLHADIADRGAEIMHALEPGFVPAHRDARAATPGVECTDDPMSAVAPPDAYFVFADRHGRHAYSRGGRLSVAEGAIVGPHGAPALGYVDGDAVARPLRIAKSDDVLGRVRNLHVERDGAIWYERERFDPRDRSSVQQRVHVGTLALARFPAGSVPRAQGALSRAPIGVEAHLGRAGDGNFAAVRTRARELGGVDLNAALMHLHDAYQQFDALAAAERAAKNTAKTAMDLVK